jgi:Putative zinc-finger
MNHSEVVGHKLVEKYVLGELSSDDREQFEEHYFDCPECASDIKALARIRAASRLILKEDAAAEVSSRERRPDRGWFAWLRPALAVPAIAALAVVVIFQATVTIPGLKRLGATGATVQVYESSYRLQGTTRSGNTSRVIVGSNESFGLDFDFTPSGSFEHYQASLLGPAGKPILTFLLNADAANKELHLVVPAGLVVSGNYQLVFVGENRAMNTTPGTDEVQRLSFSIEVRP